MIPITNLLYSQKNTTNQELIWYGYFTTFKISEKWNIQSDIQERHFLNPLAQHQFVIRAHLHRQLGKSAWESSLGMCLFLQSPNNPNSTNRLIVPELRPHIEFSYKHKINKIIFDHRIRTEARFYHNTNALNTELENGYDFGNIRMRYRIQITIPLVKLKNERFLKLKFGDEIHFNAANSVSDNAFDQNRIFAGLNFDVFQNLSFEIGYLNWYQQRPNDDFYNRNILRFSIHHKINCIKKKENAPKD